MWTSSLTDGYGATLGYVETHFVQVARSALNFSLGNLFYA